LFEFGFEPPLIRVAISARERRSEKRSKANETPTARQAAQQAAKLHWRKDALSVFDLQRRTR
jgi:hypothetical protein